MTILRDERRGEARGVLVTAAGPATRDVLHDLTLPATREYARRWRYDVLAEDLAADTDPAARLGALRAALRAYSVVVWLDADVLLVRHDEDVAALLGPRDFQGVALADGADPAVWVLRSCPAAVQFLQAVQDAGPVRDALGCAAFARRTTRLPARWLPGDGAAADRCARQLAVVPV